VKDKNDSVMNDKEDKFYKGGKENNGEEEEIKQNNESKKINN